LNINGDGITVHIHMYGILADYAGIKNIDIQIPEKTTISGFLKFIYSEKPDIFKKEIMDPESRNSIVKVFRNGELITPELNQKIVTEGDDIRFFSAISGG
jgi:sulfur carrier protein ThiS